MNIDSALFHFLNGFVGKWPLVDWLARLLVNDYLVPTLSALWLGALWFSGDTIEIKRQNQRAVIFAVIALVFTNAFIRDLQLIYFRPRPFATEQVNLLFYRPSVSSFPSVPVATLFAWATAVWMFNRVAGRMLIVLAVLFAISRVYVGVHYPLDVIGGAAIGALFAWMPMQIRWFRNGLVERVLAISERLSLA